MSSLRKPKDFYQRHINPIRDYIDQMSVYLSKMTGDDIDTCKQFIENGIKQQSFEGMVDPLVTYYHRDSTGDRFKQQTTLTQYIYGSLKEGLILAPSLTAYLHPSVMKSEYSFFMNKNKKVRSIAKKESQAAKALNDMVKYVIKDTEQANKKTFNNAMSGTFASQGSPMSNPSAHSTLTSTTRCVGSYCNAINERTLSGHRYYHSKESVIYNILSIITHTDYDAFKTVMDKYAIYYPSVDDAITVIRYSSDRYWRDLKAIQYIRNFLNTLSPIEIAAYVYTGDLYHLRLYNSDLLRGFIKSLIRKVRDDGDYDVKDVYAIDESVIFLAHQICLNEVKGKGKRYDEMKELGILKTLVPTARNIVATIDTYQDLLTVILMSSNLPPSIAYLPNYIRDSVTLSDTDSSCFTSQDWINWYMDGYILDDVGLAIPGATTYLITETVKHTLATFSANMNVDRDMIGLLSAKNEFTWAVMALAAVKKHYYALPIIQEGTVYAEPELEIKGVHLKNSNTPPSIMSDAQELMRSLLVTVSNNKKISMIAVLTHIANMERTILESLQKGDLQYYRAGIIKVPESYTRTAEELPYQHYLFWKDVFAPKYGDVEEPPLDVIKVATVLNNKTALAKWVASIEDRDLAKKLTDWLTSYKKTALNTLYLPSVYIDSYGIPLELKPIINYKNIIMDLTSVYRIVLTSLNFYYKKDLLISDLGY